MDGNIAVEAVGITLNDVLSAGAGSAVMIFVLYLVEVYILGKKW